MIKNIFFINLIIFFIVGLFYTNTTYSDLEGCEYKVEIERCNQANKNGTTNGIDDFLCIVGLNKDLGLKEQVVYQIILDLEFKKLDNEMDNFIEILEINKNIYFGKDAKKTYIDGVNDISLKKKYFNKAYKHLCSKVIIPKAASCMKDGITSIGNTINFFSNEGTSCNKLIKIKLDIFDDIAFSVLMFNKEQVMRDEKRIYDQTQRKNYDRLLDIMMVNLGYIERIWQKWPSKLANPYGS